MANFFDSLRAPGAAPSRAPRPGRDWQQLKSTEVTSSSADPDVVQSGLNEPGIRAELSKADTPEEKSAAMTRQFGEGGWDIEQGTGNPYVTNKGLESIGWLPRSGKKGVIIDSPEFEPIGDIADWRGDAFPILGATAAGMATGGAGFIPGAIAAGLGGAVGRVAQDVTELEELGGYNQQTAMEMLDNVRGSFFEGAIGEGAGRGVAALGTKLIKPNVKMLPPAAKGLMKEAESIGVRLDATQVIRAPLLGRLNGLIRGLFGPRHGEANATALLAEQNRLRAATGGKLMRPTQLGENVARDIKLSKDVFSEEAGRRYSIVDEFAGGEPVFDTGILTDRVKGIIDSMPPGAPIPATMTREVAKEGAKGNIYRMKTTPAKKTDPVSVDPGTLSRLKNTLRSDKMMSARNLADMRTALADFAQDPNLISNVDSRHFWGAHDAINTIFKEMETSTTAALAIAKAQGVKPNDALKAVKNFNVEIKAANAWYKTQRSRFDSKFINKLVKDADAGGYVDPHKVADSLSRATPTEVKKVYDVVSEQTRKDIQRATMEKLLNSAVRSKDPMTDVFSPEGLKGMMDSMTEGMKATFPKEIVTGLHRFQRTMAMVSKKDPTAGLVLANIALHPVKNFSKMAKLNALGWAMSTDAWLKWATVGLTSPSGRYTAGNRLAAMLATSGINDTESAPGPMIEQQVQ